MKWPIGFRCMLLVLLAIAGTAMAQNKHTETPIWNFANGLQSRGVDVSTGGGTVTHTGALTANRFILGNGTADIAASVSLTGLIFGNGASAPSAYTTSGTGTTVCLTTSCVMVTPQLGTPTSGVATNLTGTASGLTAGTVTTNANLTGPITSTGNATAIAAQTGTGTTFVMNTSPALVTPALGVATGTSLALGGGTALTTTNQSGTGSLVLASAPAIVGGTHTALTGLGIRDTSAAFDVVVGATSSVTLTADRALTLNMQNVAHILSFGTTANTGSGIIFPNTATDTVAMLGIANVFTAANRYTSTAAYAAAALDADVTSAFGTPIATIVNNNNSADAFVNIANVSNAVGAHFYGAKTRSSGSDANSIVSNNDELMLIRAYAADGAVYRNAASIAFQVDGTTASNSIPTRMIFSTRTTSAEVERLRIDSAGLLTVTGTLKFAGTNSTAAVAGLIGSTCPAVTCTAAYTWVTAQAADGSTVFFPVWK